MASKSRNARGRFVVTAPVRSRRVMPSSELEIAEAPTSRPPSPAREEMMPSQRLENSGSPDPEVPLIEREEQLDPEEQRASTDDEESDDSDDEGPKWSFSKRRKRAHSLDSARTRLKNKKLVYLKTNTLSAEQEKTVEAAVNLLTEEQRKQAQRRQERVASQDADNPESKPGPSQSKGKDIDPRSWGNAGIAPEELDINLQKALLYAYERG